MEINEQLSIWDFMSNEEPAEDVKILGALNVNASPKIKPFEVHLTTGDLQLIVAMIEDYIKGLDVVKAEDIQWNAYYRGKFRGISNKIQEQIDYSYAKHLEKCQKAQKKRDEGIGEEAMVLMIRKAKKEAEAKEKKELEAMEEKGAKK